MTDCRLEYMVFNPRVVGSSPTVSACFTGDVAQMGEQRTPLVKTFVGHLIEDILTAVSEYMLTKPVYVGSSPTGATRHLAP